VKSLVRIRHILIGLASESHEQTELSFQTAGEEADSDWTLDSLCFVVDIFDSPLLGGLKLEGSGRNSNTTRLRRHRLLCRHHQPGRGGRRSPDFPRTNRHDSPFIQETTLVGRLACTPCGVALLVVRLVRAGGASYWHGSLTASEVPPTHVQAHADEPWLLKHRLITH